MHPFRKISLFFTFCSGLKYGVQPSKYPFKSFADVERTRAFDCGARCGNAMMRCAGECFYAVQESRRIPTTRTTLALPESLVIAESADDYEDESDECDDPNCGCHDEDSEEV